VNRDDVPRRVSCDSAQVVAFTLGRTNVSPVLGVSWKHNIVPSSGATTTALYEAPALTTSTIMYEIRGRRLGARGDASRAHTTAAAALQRQAAQRVPYLRAAAPLRCRCRHHQRVPGGSAAAPWATCLPYGAFARVRSMRLASIPCTQIFCMLPAMRDAFLI